MQIRTRCAACGALNVGSCDCNGSRISREQWQLDYDQHRGTSTQRGYDGDWRNFREYVLSESPLCEDCTRDGRTTPATEVHHIIKVRENPGLRLVRGNVMALCKSCHSRRTARGE